MPKLQEVVQGLLTVISGLDFGFNFFSHSAYFRCKRPGRKRVPVRPRVFDWWGFEFFTHGKWKVVSERAIFLVQRWSVTWLKTGGWGSVSHPCACGSQGWQSISVTWSADPLSPWCWCIKIIQSNHIWIRQWSMARKSILWPNVVQSNQPTSLAFTGPARGPPTRQRSPPRQCGVPRGIPKSDR